MIMPNDFTLPSPKELNPTTNDFTPSFNPDEFSVEYEPEPPRETVSVRPECETFFAPGGPLKAAAEYGGRPYEFRPQQLDMSCAIADALQRGENLCVEAPTGVGKSFAYLIPLIYRSQLAARPR